MNTYEENEKVSSALIGLYFKSVSPSLFEKQIKLYFTKGFLFGSPKCTQTVLHQPRMSSYLG